MKFIPTALEGVLIIEPVVFGDPRGFNLEAWNARKMSKGGIETEFVQDNQSRSAGGVLRGLHYQIGQPQGKLVRVISGAVYDVCVDLRRSSPTFGKWLGVELSGENFRQLWIPRGFAHGFLTLSPSADVLYKLDDFYAPREERTLLWNDPELSIAWPLSPGSEPLLSQKDLAGLPLSACETFA